MLKMESFLDRPHISGRSLQITDPAMMCGIASCRPKRLNCCSNLAGFTFMYGMTALMTSTCSAYMSSQLTTLEKYFGFSSYQSGVLLSCNDIGFLTTTLIISHFARKLHIPRTLGMSSMFFGIAAIICSLAYFGSISEENRPSFLIKSQKSEIRTMNKSLSSLPLFYGQSQQLCEANRTGINNLSDACAEDFFPESGRIGAPNRFTKTAFSIMVVGLILQGIGKSPRSSLSATFIDDNGVKTKTAQYVGIISCLSIFGPAIAFGLGGLFTRIYVTLEDVPISPYHPRWVGAWWLGFLLFGSLSILVGLPLVCFPRRLRPRSVSKPKKKTFKTKDFVRGLYQLIRNPVYMLLVLCGCIDIFAVSAFVSFTPKYLETQFSLPVWLANIIMGSLGILAGGFGTLIGGFMVSKFKFPPLTCLKCLMLTKFVFVITIFTFYFLGCSNPRIVNYNARMDTNNSCSTQCRCDVMDYFPLCGSDGQNYFSPCQAACTGREKLIYTGCACVGGNATANPGLCPSDCNTGNMYGFVTMTFIGSFVGCIGIMPGFIFLIRCVSDKNKPLALGLASFLHSILESSTQAAGFGVQAVRTKGRVQNMT
ncbi:solute carrier organic anion transporter family member 2A1-like [Pecten maximus]|uniref:solute carrier organic anion transporter family member 2A1-like n=1 Tax=Pecten maximus TaxID=6579 RepID=UPI0014582491|nr:solute carrier organic anion transporter family member 2A1-like [Pecten maximus]